MKTLDKDVLKDEGSFNDWIKSNIAQIKFKSIDEVLELFKQLKKANALCLDENAEYYRAYANATSDADILEYAPVLPD